jgi:hypothetical protein
MMVVLIRVLLTLQRISQTSFHTLFPRIRIMSQYIPLPLNIHRRPHNLRLSRNYAISLFMGLDERTSRVPVKEHTSVYLWRDDLV